MLECTTATSFSEFDQYSYNFLYDNLDISIFENWVYNYSELENILKTDDYLDLLSLNFNSNEARYKIEKILNRYVDYGKFEKFYALSILHAALNSENDLPSLLCSIYDMYCNGYSFLEYLAMGYGLTCCALWDEFSLKEQEDTLKSFYPQLEIDLKRAIDWLEYDKIVLTGIKNEISHWEYIDYRTDEEKKSYMRVSKPSNDKKWWNFWK